MINKIICMFNGHNLVDAGTCPYTGSAYQYCERCTAMIPIQVAV
jgi:hypothetical protein